jgi:fructose 5-dehydrogenase small subunit
MPDHRDDCPTAFNLARRDVLGALLIGGIAAFPRPAALAAATTWSDEAAARFMEISSLLIPHRLKAEIGKRIAGAMAAADPSLLQHIDGLLSIAHQKNAHIVEDFFTDVSDGPLKDTALAIISAWYLGVISSAPDAEVFAFEYALMYQPTRDVMTIPSYAISGPNRWSAEAAPLRSMPEF